MKKTAFYVTGLIAIIAIACSKGGSGVGGANGVTTSVDCSGGTKSFVTDVDPIIQANCAISSGCHASGSNNGPGPLTTYQQVFSAKASIRSVVLNGTMPKGGRLSTAQINAIVCWIDNGATNN